MFILKACPKCHGDLVAETPMRRMNEEDDVICIQCGYCLPPEQTRSIFARMKRYTAGLKAPAEQRRLQPVLARSGR